MTRTTSERRRRASAVAVGAASLTTLALLGGSVAALFATTESDAQEIESGAVELAIEGPGETFEFSQEIKGLAAGDSVVQYADLLNRGTIGLASFTAEQGSEGPLVVDPTGLDSLIVSCTLPWVEASDSCPGTTSTLLASDLSAWGTGLIELPGLTLAAGETTHLRVRTTLDAAAPNSLQNEEATVRYTVRAYQSGAEGEEVGETTPTPSPVALASWTDDVAPLPAARFSHSSAVVDGTLYVLGGYESRGGLRLTDSVLAYDADTSSWVSRAPAPTLRQETSASVVDGVVYVVGGSGNGPYTATVEAYDAASDSWSTRAPMPAPLRNVKTVAVGGLVYAVGSLDGNSIVGRGVTYVYDPASDSWSTAARDPRIPNEAALASVGGLVYAVGGSGTNDPASTTVEVYDPRTDSWASGPALPEGRAGATAVSSGGLLYVLSGRDASNAMSRTVAVLDPRRGTWSATTPAPSLSLYTHAVEAAGSVHLLGGYSAEGFTGRSLHLR